MSTHPESVHAAVVSVALRAPLEIRHVPTVAPGPSEVRVRVDWVASTPFDLHQSDGGLLAVHPEILGDGIAGDIVEIGENVKDFVLGDKVFGFSWKSPQGKGQQEFVTVPTKLLGRVGDVVDLRYESDHLNLLVTSTMMRQIPPNITPQAAAAVPNNFVTAWHVITTYLGITLPYPKPADFAAPNPSVPILIWGGGTSVGQYTIQTFRHYGFNNITVTASSEHHELLRGLGATQLVDYKDADVLEQLEALRGGSNAAPYTYIIDAIGSQQGSVEPIAKIAKFPSLVAIVLPIVLRDASDTVAPEYSLDADTTTTWSEGVVVKGIRAHFYLEVSRVWFLEMGGGTSLPPKGSPDVSPCCLSISVTRSPCAAHQNPVIAELLQPVIMPGLLAQGIIVPNRVQIVEGKTLLERAQKALDILRRRRVSGERLVWRVSEDAWAS